MILSQIMPPFFKLRRLELMLMIPSLMGLYAVIMWGIYAVMLQRPLSELPPTILTSAIMLGGSFVLCLIGMIRLSKISVWNVGGQVLPLWLSLTAFSLLFILIFRLEYSNVFIFFNWIVGFVLLMLLAQKIKGNQRLTYGITPHVKMADLGGAKNQFIKIENMADKTLISQIDVVIVSKKDIANPDYMTLFTKLAVNKIPLLMDDVFREQMTGQVDHGRADIADLIQLRQYRRYIMVKRLSDVIMAITGLVVFSPLMAVVAVLIKIESKGPIIFTQNRIGKGGREFKMYKFRSMIRNAQAGGAKPAQANDRRITPLGRIIRKFRIDELPQLINVFNGDMSMIGPRPEQKDGVDDLFAAIPFYKFRHVIQPGITGWAQVMQGYADDVASAEVKLSYDLFYIKNLSLMMDFVIFFKTIRIIITGFGSR